MSNKAVPVRGTRDFLPEQMRLRDAMQNVILDIYRAAGYVRIQTPILEDIDRLAKSDGGENLSLIFKILKRGDKFAESFDKVAKDRKHRDGEDGENDEDCGINENELCDCGLRYDLTMPLSRYYGNNKSELRLPFKVIQTGDVFRAERPQKGRFREFCQCDIDIIGEPGIMGEIESIHTLAKALLALGFDNFTVHINDRRLLSGMILAAGFDREDIPSVSATLDKLDKIGESGVREELIDKGFAEDKADKFLKAAIKDSEASLADSPEGESLSRIMQTVNALNDGKYSIVYDPSLVRGMGYYTGPIFEIRCADFGGSIAGGGRYDKMIGKFADEDLPAVGFSIGFERIFEILSNPEADEKYKAAAARLTGGKERLALLYEDSGDCLTDVIRRAEELRAQGFEVCTIAKGKKLGKQFAALERDGFTKAAIFGEDGIKNLGRE